MKIRGPGRSHRRRGSSVAVFLLVLLICVLFAAAVPASSGDEGGGSRGWVPTDTYRVINFVVLAVALGFVLRKPLSQALKSRTQGIKDQLADLEARKDEAEKKLAEYNEKLSRLEKEAEKIIADYIKQGEDARARILKEAESAAEKLKIQARRNIDQEFEQAKLKLEADIFEKALVEAEKIIKEKITAQDQDKIVDEYLEKVVAG
jgi:F-type H+-transporting ATPase subunit b